MTEQSNNGPAWARKAQAKTKWGPGIAVVVVALLAVRWLVVSVAHGPEGFNAGGFGGPSHHQMATLIHAFYGEMDGDAHAFQKEMEASAPHGFLMPEALGSSGGLARAAAALQRRRAIIAKYRALFEQRKADHRARIGALFTDPNRQQREVAAFDNVNAQAASSMESYWGLQDDVVDREDALVADLVRSRGAWRAAGGKVIFLSPGYMQVYQRDVNAARESEAELKTLTEQMNAQTTLDRETSRAKLGE